jgi:hypothetical protein
MTVMHDGHITTAICAFVVSFQERCWQEVHCDGKSQSYDEQHWFIQEWYHLWCKENPYQSWCHFVLEVGA